MTMAGGNEDNEIGNNRECEHDYKNGRTVYPDCDDAVFFMMC